MPALSINGNAIKVSLCLHAKDVLFLGGFRNSVSEPVSEHAHCTLATRTMTFNRNHWVTLPPIHQMELVYHEMGHCALNLRHVYTNDIMKGRTYQAKVDGSNWHQLVKQILCLFKHLEKG